MKTEVKVTRDVNINQVVLEAYTHATDNTRTMSYNNATTVRPDLPGLEAVEEELFKFWTAKGTAAGSWTVRFQGEEKIQARLDVDDYIVDANIIDAGTHFVLQGWVVNRKPRD